MEQTKDNLYLEFKLEYHCDLYNDTTEPFKESLLYTIIPKPFEITKEQHSNGLIINTNIGTFNSKWIDNKFTIEISNNSISILNHTCEHCTSNTCTINVVFQRCCNTIFKLSTFKNMNFDNNNYEWIDDLCGNITVELLRGG
jgi:hypothetical protein